MGNNTGARISTGKPKIGGGLWWMPASTADPTDATTALPAAAVCLGPVSDQGLRVSRDVQTATITEWIGDTLDEVTTSETRAHEVDLLGWSDPDVLKFIYQTANVTVVAPTASKGTLLTVIDKGGDLPEGKIVVETNHKGNITRELLGVVSPRVTGERPVITADARGWTVRFNVKRSADGSFVKRYTELNDKTA